MQIPESTPPLQPPPPPMPSTPSSLYNPSGPPPAAGKNRWLLPCLVGCGCVAPVSVFVILAIIGTLFGSSKNRNETANTSVSSASTSTESGSDSDGDISLDALQPYLGKWEGSDGTTLWLRADGKGDFSGGSTSITAGTARVDSQSNTLSLKFLFAGKTWKIDAPPHEKDGDTYMTLGGTVYRRTAGFDAANASPADFDAHKVPSLDEQRRLADETMEKFDDALEARNFTGFHRYCSKLWQQQDSPARIQEAFQKFIDDGIRVADALNRTPVFSPASKIGVDGRLMLQGYYPSEPLKIYFRFSYVAEGKEWKLAGLHLKIGQPLPPA